MKRFILLFSVLVNVALLAWALRLHGQLLQARADADVAQQGSKEARQKTAEYQDQAKGLTRALADADREQGSLKKEVSSLRKTAALPTVVPTVAEKTVHPPQEARAEKRKGGMFDRLGEMMENPETRKAMRAQQKMVLNMMYGSLFEELNLGEDDLDLLKNILVDRQMLGIELIGKTKEDPEAAMDAMRDAREENGEKLEELLGEEGYQAFLDHEGSLAEQMMISQLKQSLGADSQLDAVQEEALLDLMVKQRKAVGMPDQQEQAIDFMAGGEGAAKVVESYLAKQEEANERVLTGAAEFLSEAQLKQLGDFQRGQLQMQKMGMEMIKGMNREEE